MRRRLILLAVIVLLPFLALACRTVNVTPTSVTINGSPVCSSAAHDNDPARPGGMITCAMGQAQPGDQIALGPGVYFENVSGTFPAGTSSSGVGVGAASGNQDVIIEGVANIAGVDWWTFQDLTWVWPQDPQSPTPPATDLFILHNASHVTIQDSVFADQILCNADHPELVDGCRQAAVLLTSGVHNDPIDHITLTGNCVHGDETGIYIDSDQPGDLITRNVIFDHRSKTSNAPGRGIKLGPPGDTGGGSHVTISYNTIDGYAASAAADVSESKGASNDVVDHNLLVNAHQGYNNVSANQLTNPSSDSVTNNRGWAADGGAVADSVFARSGNVYGSFSFASTGTCSGYTSTSPASVGQTYGRYATP